MLNVWIFTMKIAAYDTGRGASQRQVSNNH